MNSSPVPDADAAPAAYASDYTQYFVAPEPAPEANQYHSQDDAGTFYQLIKRFSKSFTYQLCNQDNTPLAMRAQTR